MRLGIDWGGTKIEIIALNDNGHTLFRKRVPTPIDTYEGSLDVICDLVNAAEAEIGQSGSLGIGFPGTISPTTRLVKSVSLPWLKNMPLVDDLETRLDRTVRIQNDANCFAVSEAQCGAGDGAHLVTGLILGTGVGCGLAFDGVAHEGHHGIAGEFGHIPLPWPQRDEYPGEQCWCGQMSCTENWISGTGFQKDFQRRSGEARQRSVTEILALGSALSKASYEAFCSRLARSIALLVCTIDPDVIVLGGGMSNVTSLYDDVPPLVGAYVFGDEFNTPIVPPKHGDSSGVRGAALLW